jgi:HEXXH motif-containing protein
VSDDGGTLGSNHLVSLSDFQALAGGSGDQHVVVSLMASERSWRLAAVLALLKFDTHHVMAASPLGTLDEAWALLTRAAEVDPDVAEDLLARPEVGIWAAHALRRLSTNAPSDPPLWVDLGYLHALAAAAVVRTRLTATLEVPVRYGTVVVPTVGAATIPSDATYGVARVVVTDGTATVSTAAGGVRIAPGTKDWYEPVRVEAAVDGVTLAVELADRDAYRDLRAPTRPRPLSAAAIDRWRRFLGESWSLLVRDHRTAAQAIAGGLRMIAPLPAKEPFRHLSASGGEAFGGVLLSEPDDAVQLAATLVHEFQHQKLGALLHLLTFAREGTALRYYAGWRDDPRPLSGLLQGAYAFAGVARFWNVHRRTGPPAEQAVAHFEFALWSTQTLLVLRTLAESGALTEHGERLVTTLLAQVETYQHEPVPNGEATTAADMAADHHALWRAHNLVVPDATVDELLDAWRRGAPPPATDRVPLTARAAPKLGFLDTRAVLTRHRLSREVAFERFLERPDSVSQAVAGATPADVQLVAGARETAHLAYLARASESPDDVHALVGLGIARPDRDTDPVARALLGCPELVRAIGVRLTGSGAVDILGLAGWLGKRRSASGPEPTGWPTD